MKYLKFSVLVLLFFHVSCVSRTNPDDLVFENAGDELGRVYIYMPKSVDIRGGAEEAEFLYVNDESLGSIEPGTSIGFLYKPGFINITTRGLYQEKLERRFYLNPGERLFIAMEKGINLREDGFLLYQKTEDEGVAGIRRTRYRVVTPGEMTNE